MKSLCSYKVLMSVRFKNKKLFGDTFDAYWLKAQGHVMTLLLSGKVEKDGSVTGGELAELWSYIYLLYLNNKNYDVFDAMRGRRGRLMSKATAKRFIKVVTNHMKVKTVEKETLIAFINDVIKTRNPVNPVKGLLLCQWQGGCDGLDKELRDMQEQLTLSNVRERECRNRIMRMEGTIRTCEERLAKLTEIPCVAPSALARAGKREQALQDKVDLLRKNVKTLERRLTLLNATYEQKSAQREKKGIKEALKLDEALFKISQLRERVAALKEYPAKVLKLEGRLTKCNDFVNGLMKEMGVVKAEAVIPVVRSYVDRIRYLEDENKKITQALEKIKKAAGVDAAEEIVDKFTELRRSARKVKMAW